MVLPVREFSAAGYRSLQRIHYPMSRLDVFVGGRVGQLGSPLVRGAVERGLDKFFNAFEQHVLNGSGASG